MTRLRTLQKIEKFFLKGELQPKTEANKLLNCSSFIGSFKKLSESKDE